MNTPTLPTLFRPIRLPFRVLAGIICVIALVGIAGMVFRVWHGDEPLKIYDLVMVPPMAWFLRFAFYAAFHGRTPPDNPYWPLASRFLLNLSFLLMVACSIFKL